MPPPGSPNLTRHPGAESRPWLSWLNILTILGGGSSQIGSTGASGFSQKSPVLRLVRPALQPPMQKSEPLGSSHSDATYSQHMAIAQLLPHHQIPWHWKQTDSILENLPLHFVVGMAIRLDHHLSRYLISNSSPLPNGINLTQ
ncbi:Hypothetical predicted protein [Marmota monax]|uniref:Uncharacterized protein n=1 Tax=Marmota monax TaxID=9995 RepID=A0A5E4CV91_MARMO|nr:hypothetical protein GHT09_014984 [Marmota monax]VTJ85734.1 Hypothetical predicted protein [Marmota monax]